MGTFDVRAEKTVNRLYVTFTGFFDDEEADRACAAILTEAKKLSPGFSIITDIAEFRATTPGGSEEISRLQSNLGAMGVRRVVRVVGAQVLANMQLNRTAREANYGPGVDPVTADSVEEAELLLGE